MTTLQERINRVREKKNKKEELPRSPVSSKLLTGVATFLLMCGVASSAKGQTTENNDNNNKKTTTKLTTSYNNFTGLQLNNNGTLFLNDFSPSLSFNVNTQKGFYGNFNAQELIIARTNSAIGSPDWNFINALCLLELGRQFGNGAKLYIKTGRSPSEFFANFLNTPSMTMFNEDNGSPWFNLSNQAVIGVMTPDGTAMDLGMITKPNDGVWGVIPHPEHADFWAKVSKNMEVGGLQVSLTGAAQFNSGKLTKIHGTVSGKNNDVGFTVGGNYDVQQKNLNVLERVNFNKDNGLVWILQTAQSVNPDAQTLYLDLGVSKDGTQVTIGGQVVKDKKLQEGCEMAAYVAISHAVGGKKTRRY